MFAPPNSKERSPKKRYGIVSIEQKMVVVHGDTIFGLSLVFTLLCIDGLVLAKGFDANGDKANNKCE